MTTFKEYLMTESINDKGLFKAIFVVGLPGAGKSYTISQVNGAVKPRIVNSDIALEFLAKKRKMAANKENWPKFRDSTKKITSMRLKQYINGMLPLFIDGTSNDISNIMSRVGILKSIGYDVGMVYVDIKVEYALKNAASREEKIGREVTPEFIAQVEAETHENRKEFEREFSGTTGGGEAKFYKTVDNNPGEFNNAAIMKIFKEVQGFYSEDVENPTGKRALKELTETKGSYLVPTIWTDEQLDKKVNGWFKT